MELKAPIGRQRPRLRRLRFVHEPLLLAATATLGVFETRSMNRAEFAVLLAAAEALGQAGDPRLIRKNWIRIDGGMAGLKSFELGKYVVTVQEYTRFIKTCGHRDKQWRSAAGFYRENRPRYWDRQKERLNWPVTWSNWYQASAYAAWAGGRLLTEIEWQWAAQRSPAVQMDTRRLLI